VTYYCFKEGLIIRGLLHDLSKFRLSEWLPYANYFYGDRDGDKARRENKGYYKPYNTGDERFDFAWLLHQKRNDHHWQWWILPLDDGGFKTLPMKRNAALEMICDWRGAGRALGFGDDTLEWYEKNKENIILHETTKQYVYDKIGYTEPD
jgi:hypothetical protein